MFPISESPQPRQELLLPDVVPRSEVAGDAGRGDQQGALQRHAQHVARSLQAQAQEAHRGAGTGRQGGQAASG